MSPRDKKTAVLLLAHGSPNSVDEVPNFLLRITGGRPLPHDVIEEAKHRYGKIGKAPLTELTLKQGELLEKKIEMPVYVGMRNWRPFISQTLSKMVADGVRHAIVICLAPQNSRTSVGLYRTSLKSADPELSFDFVESWHDQPSLIKAFAGKLAAGLERADWRFAFQSQGMSGGAWIGPTVEATILDLKRSGHNAAFIQPIGFLCDHVEVLYDVDVIFKEFAEKEGMRLWRADSLNDSPLLTEALADIVHSRMPALRQP